MEKLDDTQNSLGSTLEGVEEIQKNLTIVRKHASELRALDASLFKDTRAKSMCNIFYSFRFYF